MKKITIIEAHNGLVVQDAEQTTVFAPTKGEACMLRELLRYVAENVNSDLRVSITVEDPAGIVPPSIDSKKEWLTSADVEDIYGVKKKTLEKWRADGTGPEYSKVGGVKYNRRKLDNYMQQKRVLTAA